MYEINLVPDVKSELIQKQKLRNLIIMICVLVAIACGSVCLILLGVIGGQSISIAGQENERKCRLDGSGDNCNKIKGMKTAILKTENVDQLLTIQDEMKTIGSLNNEKIKFSRIFGLLDVALPNNSDDVVKISELTADIAGNTLAFNAVGKSSTKIGYHALEAFKKSVARSYFDYGEYMRKDEDGNYVAIPSYCIVEKTEKGIIYGYYYKGTPGCEAPMIEKEEEKKTGEDETNTEENATEDEQTGEEQGTGETEQKEEKKIEIIKIRRTYKTSADMEEYKNGNDNEKKENEDNNSGKYYFESQCIKYGDNGKIDEAETIAACPLTVEDGIMADNPGYGKNSEGEMVLTFQASLTIDERIFKASSKYMTVFGPSRQNVTDSYIQIRNMFSENVESTKEAE